ncbi:hypothetical protein DS2_18713 [Catenovulum agarivorans DS-2]|uniref:Uncharacterized protein n=1 Tax=Catenovulum agarivorans DS-2 TaxID=1328313 RepID=W7Q5Y1_9ALTE|nr:hypothetical protein [Catenovulum agarivorans]EWH08174.1 hypothetical protein DS2_18713 [Catenovulum agarivorans DS-2]
MSQLNTYQQAVLAELSIDYFQTNAVGHPVDESSQASTPVSSANVSTNQAPESNRSQIDHLSQIKSVIGMSSPAQVKPAEVVQAEVTPLSAAVHNLAKLDAIALCEWLSQSGLSYRHQQMSQDSYQFTFEPQGQQQEFDLAKGAEQKAFWQFLCQLVLK